jgi:hypothetical protein
MGTELINLRTKDQNGQKGYSYYKQKYGDRWYKLRVGPRHSKFKTKLREQKVIAQAIDYLVL